MTLFYPSNSMGVLFEQGVIRKLRLPLFLSKFTEVIKLTKKSIFLLVIHEQPLLQLKGYSGNFSVRGTAVLSSNVANRATWCHEMGQV